MSRVLDLLSRLIGRTPDARRRPEEAWTETQGNEHLAAPIFADVLEIWGDHAFDLDEISSDDICVQFHDWAAHVRDGSPPPESVGRRPAGQRDWSALKAACTLQRRREQHFVQRNVKGLRDTLWGFVHKLSRSFGAAQGDDSQIKEQLGRLESAVESDSLSALKREVAMVVDRVGRIVEERARRQARELEETVHELANARQELDRTRGELMTDALTRLYNRAAFDEQLHSTVAMAQVTRHPVCLAMIDVDRFKAVNDTFGHPAGDEVLKRLADCMVRAFPRKCDIVSRYGGEEFAIILAEDAIDAAEVMIRRLIDQVRRMVVSWEGQEIRVTVSVGLTQLLVGEPPLSFLERADAALYQAKHDGRDRAVTWDEDTATIKT